jgi:probable HAF family extracellular repeat protein
MKTILISITAGISLAVLAAAQPQPRYTVIDLGTLGGAYSYAYGINNAGQVSGGAATAVQNGGLFQTGFVWYHGHIIDLGTLAGPACTTCSSEGAAPNMLGAVAVISETSQFDPNGEDFCGFGTHRQCLTAIWQNGKLKPLATLAGGNNAQTYWLNNRGLVVGVAENGTYDATCVTATPYQRLQFEAVIWEANGIIRELPHLPGDTVAFGFGINDHGQAVGVSGLCAETSAPPVSPFSGAPHGVLWDEDGSPNNLGSLGGSPAFVVPSAINNRGEVAGTSRAKDGNLHPFLWTKKTGMRDLGTFDGNRVTAITCCNTLNNRGDAVGLTADASGNMTAILWHDDIPTDLNRLVPADSPLYLQSGGSINDSGQIVGTAILKSSCPPVAPSAEPAWLVNQSACTEVHAFMVTRQDSEDDRETSVGAPTGTRENNTVALPQRIRFGPFRP